MSRIVLHKIMLNVQSYLKTVDKKFWKTEQCQNQFSEVYPSIKKIDIGNKCVLNTRLTNNESSTKNDSPNFLNHIYNVQNSISSYMVNLQLKNLEFLIDSSRISANDTAITFNMDTLRLCVKHNIVGVIYKTSSIFDPQIESFVVGCHSVNEFSEGAMFKELSNCLDCVAMSRYSENFNLWICGKVLTFYPPSI